MTKVQSYVTLVLPNVIMSLSNVSKKIRASPNVTMKPLNVSKKRKEKRTTECDKSMARSDVDTA